MSTQLFLRLTASDLGGAGQQALSVTRGAASHTAVTNTTASGTNIQVTATAAGQVLTWFSQPLAGITISGSVTVNIWGFESSASANSKAGVTIEHTDSLGNVLSTIVANTAVPTTSSEYGLTPGAAKNASFTPTSTALNYGDRIKVTLFVKNQGTMGGGFTVTNSYDGPTAAAAGDTYVTFTETLFPAYSGGPQGWSSPAGIRAVYVRTGNAMATPIPVVTASPPVITTTSLPAGIVGRPYSATLAATGGTGPYTWSISSGSLPSGLTLAPSTGIISGTPGSPPGTASFTVEVTDASSSTATQPLSITIGVVSSQQALRAKLPKVPLRGVYSGWAPGPASNADTSFGTGQIQWNAGAPLRNPGPGPVFRPAVQAARARLPVPLLRGRVASSAGAPLRNPNHGPPAYPPQGPARARLPQLQPRAGRTGSNAGAPVRNPGTGPAFRQAVQPVKAALPVPLLRGRAYSRPGAPLHNPGTGPPFTQKTFPAKARITLPPRGRGGGNKGAPLVPAPPVIAPAPPRTFIRARMPLPRRGICRTVNFLPVQAQPQQGPAFIQATSPARARITLPPRGRIWSNKGGRVPPPPVAAPFRQVPAPVRIRPALPARGRISFNAGAPVHNPNAGPVFRQRLSAPLVQPLPRRGTCRAIKFYPLIAPPPFTAAVAIPLPGPVRAQPGRFLKGRAASGKGAPLQNPGTGPVFRQATQPARIRPQLPPKGRAGSNPGTPAPPPSQPGISSGQPAGIRVIYLFTGRTSSTSRAVTPQNPGTGPVFRQAVTPARTRIVLPPRGRTGSNPGGPVPPPPIVAVFHPAVSPARIRVPQNTRGRVYSHPGAPVRNPGSGPVFRQAVRPAQARFPLPSRGRIGSNPGTLPPPPPVPAKIYPLPGPARTRITLPPRGRIASGKGAPVHNPNPGPVFRQAVRPIRGIIPQNAPRGRTGSNPGGPVENIPFRQVRITLGQPYTSWETGAPYTSWLPGQPYTDWETDGPD